MLPSGNDAAHQLAEYFGGILREKAAEELEREKDEARQLQSMQE